VTFPNGTCPVDAGHPTSVTPNSQLNFITEDGAAAMGGTATGSSYLGEMYQQLYRFRPKTHANSKLCWTCNTYPMCPELDTCVVSRNRFESEAALMRSGDPAESVLGCRAHRYVQCLPPEDGDYCGACGSSHRDAQVAVEQ